MDRFDCYELCVQSPRHITRFLRDLHARAGSGDQPTALREDFCGTAAISRRWIAEARKAGLTPRAIATDLDPAVIARARADALGEDVLNDLALHIGDAIHAPVAPADACDVVFVGNFSIGYIASRSDLLGYLARSRERLALGNAGFGGGVFVCDIYDSPSKYTLGCVNRRHPSRGRELIHYTWEHRSADILNARVENAIHFRIELDGEIVQELFDAFVYRWRLWSIVELRDAMHEVGFGDVQVFAEVADGARPIGSSEEMPESGVVCVAARN